MAKTARQPSRLRSRSRAPRAAVEEAPGATSTGASPGNAIFWPTFGEVAIRVRAKVAARIKRRQLQAKTLAEEAADGAPKSAPRKARVRVGAGMPRGRLRKKPDGGHGFAPDVVAGLQNAAT